MIYYWHDVGIMLYILRCVFFIGEMLFRDFIFRLALHLIVYGRIYSFLVAIKVEILPTRA